MGLPAQQEFEFLEPAEYLGHRDSAYFSILTRAPSGRMSQKSHPVEFMPEIVQGVISQKSLQDTWISQAEFYAPTRRIVHLSRLGLLFADLDTYKLEGLPSDPHKLTDALRRYCEKVALPEPNLVVFSGRGLQAKWILDGALPSQALPRWNALQTEINRRLEGFGADAKALDASRVLRLVETLNTKSNQVVRITHHSTQRYSFDQLAKELLPFWRNSREVDARCDQLDLNLDASGNVILFRPGEGEQTTREWRNHREAKNTVGLRQFMGFQLAWDRLADLRKLAELRGGVPDGQRDTFVFLSAVFLSQATLDQNKLYHELYALAKEFVPHWPRTRVLASASSALKRLKAHIAGDRVVFEGREVSPRYRFKNSTLIESRWLGVTPSEERELRTIVSEEEAKRRDASRAAQKRLDAGQTTRQGYLESGEQKRATARLMRAQGSTWQEIADTLGYKTAESARIASR